MNKIRKFFVSAIIGIALLLNISVVNAVDLKDTTTKTSQINRGVVPLAYNTTADKKLKVIVEKDGKKVTYNLKNDGTVEYFPLQYGNGNYKVSVLENISGTKYKYLKSETVKLNLKNPNDVYLSSVQNINWNENMAAIKKANELTKGLKNDSEKIKKIYEFAVNNFSYDYEKLKTLNNDYLPDIDKTLKAKKGICYDYSSMIAAMLRSQGIPTKLVKGYADKVDGYHAWNEIYDESKGRWIIVDATYDSQMKAAKVKYSFEKKASAYRKVNEY